MTSLFSPAFFAFFLPLVVALYCVTPRRYRWVVLLVSSYAFFWTISGTLIVFLLLSTLSIYLIGLRLGSIRKGLCIEKAQASGTDKKQIARHYKRRKRLLLATGLLFNFGILAACKYLTFAESLTASLLHLLGFDVTIDLPVLAAPIGISFYTLIAASYLVDVARGTIEADRNLGRVALFLSFFPQIVEGPICRYKDTSAKLTEGSSITRSNLYAGTLRILWGIAKKVIIADRLNAFVKPVFDSPASFDGGIIALGAVLYTLQLYCDFSGAIDVALGSARIFNVRLPENFRQPFFARSASEFWERWHITLSTWLRDYVYYPLSLSKPAKRLTSYARKRVGNYYGPIFGSLIALLAVWAANGLWHGAGSQYIFFGLYYFVIILAGRIVEPLAQRAAALLKVNRHGFGYRMFQIARTLIIVVVGELFFRAQGLDTGISMFWQICSNFSLASFESGSVLSVGMDVQDYFAVGFGAIVIFCIGLVKERGIDVTERLSKSPTGVKCGIWLALAMSIVLFGAYGANYAPLDPIYAQF